MGLLSATTLNRAASVRLALISLGLVVLLAGLLAAPASADDSVKLREADQSGARAYWTPERMRAAEPPPEPDPGSGPDAAANGPGPGPPTAIGPVEPGSPLVSELEPTTLAAAADDAGAAAGNRDEINDPSAEPFRAHGKVFFTINGGSVPGDYVCSATAINSNNGSAVWTAGHCVYDIDGGGFATNWIFVPGYKNGSAPFGEWPATKLATTNPWKGSGNLSYDLGAAEVSENGQGQTLNDVVGGRGIGFNQARNQTYQAFGYPAMPPPLEFTGGREFRCTSGLKGTDNPPGSGPHTNYMTCDMTGGSSGGGWLAAGSVLSVISYSYCLAGVLCDRRLYGPYQEQVAKSLYGSIAGEAELCAGRPVTHLGTGGDDRLVGTRGPDVIKAGPGNDNVIAKGGDDLVCAGPGDDMAKGNGGRDTLKGQAGEDTLKGQRGRDRLGGGADDDLCNGGRGRDRARSCETEQRIP